VLIFRLRSKYYDLFGNIFLNEFMQKYKIEKIIVYIYNYRYFKQKKFLDSFFDDMKIDNIKYLFIYLQTACLKLKLKQQG